MKELKTLKDIYGNKANGQVSLKELKAEAIKWVKKYERAGWLRSAEDFKRFFNLTEEDLK